MLVFIHMLKVNTDASGVWSGCLIQPFVKSSDRHVKNNRSKERSYPGKGKKYTAPTLHCCIKLQIKAAVDL
jgi:hypothetical protein